MTSRSSDEITGIEIFAEEGSILERKRLAFSKGTRIEVRELFFNIPVRRRFLKSKATEVNNIVSLVSDYSLCYPEIEWSLVSDKKLVFTTSGNGRIIDVLKNVFPEIDDGDALFVEYVLGRNTTDAQARSDVGLTGSIIRPHIHRTTRNGQHFFVNRRPVRNRIFFRAIDDVFREYISPGKHPLCALNIDISPADIDVNIHPSKYEVNFSDAQTIYMMFINGLKSVLSETAGKTQRLHAREIPIFQSSPGIAVKKSDEKVEVASQIEEFTKLIDRIDTDKTNTQFATRQVPLYTQDEKRSVKYLVDEDKRRFDNGEQIENDILQNDMIDTHPGIKGSRQFGQISNMFIVFYDKETLYLVDQHAAHERILFEEIYERYRNGFLGAPKQALMFPVLLSLRPFLVSLLNQYIPILQSLGFDVEIFGEDTILLREVPAIIASRVSSSLFKEMINEIIDSEKEKSYSEMVKHVAATAACKYAVKAGESLSESEIEWIVKTLTSIKDSSTCPHGRPTMLKLDARVIGKLFQRS